MAQSPQHPFYPEIPELDTLQPIRRVNRWGFSSWLGLILVITGVVALLKALGLLWWLTWGIIWPAALILLGIGLIWRRLRPN